MQMQNNPMQMIQEFMKFQANFRGNPQEEVMKLLQSGQINQKQLNELQGMANQMQSMLKGMRFIK